jgi:hypothetical protein
MDKIVPHPDRLARLNHPDVHLIGGTSDMPHEKWPRGSVMNWAVFLTGESGESDAHPSIDETLRAFCNVLNHSEQFGKYRDELKPYAVRVLNTAGGLELSMRRGFLCADWALRIALPLIVSAYRQDDAIETALRGLRPLGDREACLAALPLAQTVRDLLDYKPARYTTVAGFYALSALESAAAATEHGEAHVDLANHFAAEAARDAAHVAQSGAANYETYMSAFYSVHRDKPRVLGEKSAADELTEGLWSASLGCLEKLLSVV